MRFSYYPGCALHGMSEEYHASVLACFQKLGIELVELGDWNCCGATPAHSSSEYLSYALPLRNLVMAEAEGHPLLLPCAACYNSFRLAHHGLAEGKSAAVRANRDMVDIMGRQYGGTVQIHHALEPFLDRSTLDSLGAAVVRPLRGLRLAPYYGCLLSRPSKAVAFDDPEQPQIMDRVIEALGAEPVRWSCKTDCCGASLAASQPDLVGKLCTDLAGYAREAGADAIVTACPLCQTNLDTRQRGSAPLPVFFFTELMGVAMGLRESKGWLSRHVCDPTRVLDGLEVMKS